MKTTKHFLLFLIFIFVLTDLKANHLLGASIYYKSIGNNQYEVFVDYYRDCRGVPFSGPALIIKNVNTGEKANFTSKVQEYSFGSITPVCKTATKPCNPANTVSGFGFEKHRYKVTIDLTTWKNAGACQILIGTGQCCRQTAITTGASGQDFWVSAMIDLCSGSGNSSVVFGEDPPLLMNCNLPVKYNPAASDYIDNDSLVYELADPMKDTTNTSWGSGFSSQNPFTVFWPTGYDKTKGPDPKANPPVGFYMNNFTGDMIFTPNSCSEITVSALRVSEYRKDSTGKYKLVGYASRDFETIVQNSVNNNIPMITATDIIYIPDNIKTCFTISSTDSPGSSIKNDTTALTMYPFTPYKNASVTFNIIDTKAKLKSALVCWEPKGLARTQPYQMEFKVIDNNCNYYSSSNKTVLINVLKPASLTWIEGLTYFDNNKNCKLDSSEALLPNQKIVFGTGITYEFQSDSTGRFEKAIPEGNYSFKISNKFGAFVCNKTLNILKGNQYKFDLGATPKMHITGTIYKDSIKNCKFETAERKWASHMVFTDPGNYITSADAAGKFDFKIPAGDYKIKYRTAGANFFVKCLLPTVSAGKDTLFTNQNIAILDSSDIIDVSSKIISAYNFERGGNHEVTVVVKNNGSRTISSANLWFTFNKKLKFVSATSYILKTDSTIKWNFTNLPADKELRFYIVLNADASTCKPNDTMSLFSLLDTTGLGNETSIINNYDSHKIKISGKTDPNIKTEFLSNGYTWREGNKLRYYIQFRNTGKKTIKNVWVTDTLPFPISGSSFQMLGASHTNTYSINNNVLKVNFTGINLPDSTTDKLKSKGYFEFSTEIDPGTNTQIKFYNKAEIYFDTIVPIRTKRFYNTYTSYINTGKTNSNNYCINDSLKVSYSSRFIFNSGNKFRLILSNADGLFDSKSKVLDSLSSTSVNGTFKVKLPSSISFGTNYKVKVVSTNPYSMELADGVSNSFKIFTSAYKPIITTRDSFVCGDDSIQFTIASEFDSTKIYDRKTLIGNFGNKSLIKLKLSPGKHFITASGNISSCLLSSDTLIIRNDTLPIIKLFSTTHPNLKGCVGDTVIMKATGAKTYTFYNNSFSILEQNNSGNYADYGKFKLGSVVRVIGESITGCKDTSNYLFFFLYTLPNTKLTVSDLTICKGESITFTGSGADTFYLIKNGKAWLSKFYSAISTADINDGDSIKLLGKTYHNCPLATKSVGFKVNPAPTVVLTCTDPDLTLCDGSNFTTFNFAGAYEYKLYKNGILLSNVTGNSYNATGINNKDRFMAQGTSVDGCTTNSKTLTILIKKAAISFTVNKGGPACDGDSIRFNFTGGISYDVYKNRVLWQTINKQSFTIRSMTQNDSIYVSGTDSLGCKANSAKYVFNILPGPAINIIDFNHPTYSHCEGENVVINIIGVAKHDLYKNGTLWKPGLGTTVTFSDIVDKDEIYASGIAANGCKGFSNLIKFTVWPIPSKPILTRTGNDLFSSYISGNQWYEDITKIIGATNQKYTPVKSAGYYVTHTSKNGCESPLSDKYSYALGITKVNILGLKIYPNPASDYIKIETAESAHYKVNLVDITGKLIQEASFIGKTFEWHFKLEKGIYQLIISNEKGQVKTQSLEIY